MIFEVECYGRTKDELTDRTHTRIVSFIVLDVWAAGDPPPPYFYHFLCKLSSSYVSLLAPNLVVLQFCHGCTNAMTIQSIALETAPGLVLC